MSPLKSKEEINNSEESNKKDSKIVKLILRLNKFGCKRIIKSPDFYIGVITLIILLTIHLLFDKSFQLDVSEKLLETIINVTGSFFAIVLAAFSIIFAFSNEKFLVLWRKIDRIDDLVTLYQYNLVISLLILVFAFINRFWLINYQVVTIFTISSFIYLISSLILLTHFTCEYALLYSEYLESEDEK